MKYLCVSSSEITSQFAGTIFNLQITQMKKVTYLLIEFGVVVSIGVNTSRIPYLLRPVYRLICWGGQYEQLMPLMGQQPRVHLLTHDNRGFKNCNHDSLPTWNDVKTTNEQARALIYIYSLLTFRPRDLRSPYHKKKVYGTWTCIYASFDYRVILCFNQQLLRHYFFLFTIIIISKLKIIYVITL